MKPDKATPSPEPQKVGTESCKLLESGFSLPQPTFCAAAEPHSTAAPWVRAQTHTHSQSKEINATIRDMRFLRINQIVKKLNEILTGYYHYYGITDNSRSLNSFYNVVWFRLFYWLNRRSQRRSYTKEGYKELMRQFPLVRPRIYVSIYG